MSNKMQEKDIDERIRQAFQESNPKLIEDLIDLSISERVSYWNRLINYLNLNDEQQWSHLREACKISDVLLKDILIARDKKVLELKNCEISEVYAKELKLDEEFQKFNDDLPEDNKITMIQAKDRNGKNNVLCYYTSEFGNVISQQRVFNEKGDIENIKRQSLYIDGKCELINDVIMVYDYDKHANKKSALYCSNRRVQKYFEFDETGKLKGEVTSEYIMQRVQEGGNSYEIFDGCIEPDGNDFDYKYYEFIEELTPEDMERVIVGNVSLKARKALMHSMDAKRKEEVLSALRAVEPIFENCKTTDILDEENISKMQKCVQWLSGFAKRLEIDPKLAVQDVAVMSAMRSAVGKTVGNTRNAEMELKTPVKEEIKEK